MSANGLAGRIASHAMLERMGSDPTFMGVSPSCGGSLNRGSNPPRVSFPRPLARPLTSGCQDQRVDRLGVGAVHRRLSLHRWKVSVDRRDRARLARLSIGDEAIAIRDAPDGLDLVP